MNKTGDVKPFHGIQIQYFGAVRAAAKKSEEKVDFAVGITVYSLLRQVACNYENGFRGEIFDINGDELRDDLTVSLNGAIISRTDACETILKQGDVLSLFPIFPGGG